MKSGTERKEERGGAFGAGRRRVCTGGERDEIENEDGDRDKTGESFLRSSYDKKNLHLRPIIKCSNAFLYRSYAFG